MPVHENLYKPTDPLDLTDEGAGYNSANSLQGMLGHGDLRPAGAGGTGSFPLGRTDIAVPTGVSAAHAGAAGTADVTYIFPAGITKVSIIVRKNSDKSFIKKVESTASPQNITGLTTGTNYDFAVRGVRADGAQGRSAAVVSTIGA